MRMILDHSRVSEADGHVWEFTDLLNLNMKGDSLHAFWTDWNSRLLGMKVRPDDMYLLSVIQQKVKHHPGLKRDWEDFERMSLSDPRHSYDGVQKFIDAYLERQRVK